MHTARPETLFLVLQKYMTRVFKDCLFIGVFFFCFLVKVLLVLDGLVGELGWLLQFSVKVTFCEKYVRCISVNVYIKFISRVNKLFHTIDIPFCS